MKLICYSRNRLLSRAVTAQNVYLGFSCHSQNTFGISPYLALAVWCFLRLRNLILKYYSDYFMLKSAKYAADLPHSMYCIIAVIPFELDALNPVYLVRHYEIYQQLRNFNFPTPINIHCSLQREAEGSGA